MSHNITNIDDLAWRKAQASAGQGVCVELAPTPDGDIAMRNSRFPTGPALVYTKDEIAAFVDGAKKSAEGGGVTRTAGGPDRA